MSEGLKSARVMTQASEDMTSRGKEVIPELITNWQDENREILAETIGLLEHLHVRLFGHGLNSGDEDRDKENVHSSGVLPTILVNEKLVGRAVSLVRNMAREILRGLDG